MTPAVGKKPIKVLICDDSAVIRQMLTAIFDPEPDIEVVATAIDAADAREKIKQHNPDVLTLDVEMPGMDGVSFLEKIMTLRPMPVIMISTLTQKGTSTAMRAIEIGAFDVIGKPTSAVQERFNAKRHEIINVVKAAAQTNISTLTAKRVISHSNENPVSKTVDIIGIGASTGGVVALNDVIPFMSKNCPPVVVTQHMPAGFTTSFSKRLNEKSNIQVVEAKDGELLKAGTAYIAPGNLQMQVVRKGASMKIKLTDGPLVSGHKPSVDVLFHSISELPKCNSVGVILTGMGRDGASGMLAMRKNGSPTFAQDEASCVVYGMPRVAVEVGAAGKIVPLAKILTEIDRCCWPDDKA